MKIIDPHIHLFDLAQGDYYWLKPGNAPFWPDKAKIHRDFSETDLKLANEFELAGFVHIEAGFDNQTPWREIAWLASTCALPFRSVAGVNIENFAHLRENLARLESFDSVVGVRHILDEEAPRILSQSESLDCLALLAENKLHFELQMSFEDSQAVEILVQSLRALPELRVVINHAGFPPYAQARESLDWRVWQDNLAKAASFDRVAIKCSGFEMKERLYSKTWQLNVISACVETFGIDRVMAASNFPLCELSMSYNQYWQTIADLTLGQWQKLLFANAQDFYQF